MNYINYSLSETDRRIARWRRQEMLRVQLNRSVVSLGVKCLTINWLIWLENYREFYCCLKGAREVGESSDKMAIKHARR